MLSLLGAVTRVHAHWVAASTYAASCRLTSMGWPSRLRSRSQRHNVVRWTFSRVAASSRDSDEVMAARMIEASGRVLLRPMQRTVAESSSPVKTLRCNIHNVANSR